MEDSNDYVQKHLLLCISASNWEKSSELISIFGKSVVRLTRYVRKQPPQIVKRYFETGNGYIGDVDSKNDLRFLLVYNETCLELIRDHNWTPSLIWGNFRNESEKQSSIGYINLINPEDKSSANEALGIINLARDYPYIVAIKKADVKHDWHSKYDILNSPDTLIYDLDDIESVANIYRALVRKMTISDEDKQGFLGCIDWQVQNQNT